MVIRINRVLQTAVDGLIIALSVLAAYWIRFEGETPYFYLKQFLFLAPYIVLVHLGFLAVFGIYRLVWRYISLRDVLRVIVAVFAGSVMLIAARFVIHPVSDLLELIVNKSFFTIPYGVVVAEFVISTSGLIAARVAWRMYHEHLARRRHLQLPTPRHQRALLIGAGSAGVMIARELKSNPSVGFDVVGFLDDDPNKHGSIIEGHRVWGETNRLPEIAQKHRADLVILSMARAPAASVRRIIKLAEDSRLTVKIIPGLYDILAGRISISKIRDVAIEDLLGRDMIRLDEDQIASFIRGKTVMITGAGGSIGSEICRQVARYGPKLLLLVDQAENPLFHIEAELRRSFANVPLVTAVGNVVNKPRMHQIMIEQRPNVVFHAAAHKHVPLMEQSPGESIRNNVLGTCNVADLAHELGINAFVMISTDKAVNPTSVMGATKRLAEVYVHALAHSSSTRFITVRFGNVLGSEGSVIPIFKQQISRGGPITVTHPEMKRYFMTIPEASQLVLQASAMGDGGEIFILEMGEPVLIVNLARDLIRLSGFVPDEDIRIEFTGIRAGEKLSEEINLTAENASKTKHPRIWIGKCREVPVPEMRRAIADLVRVVDSGVSPDEIRVALTRCVPEYTPHLIEPARPAVELDIPERQLLQYQ